MSEEENRTLKRTIKLGYLNKFIKNAEIKLIFKDKNFKVFKVFCNKTLTKIKMESPKQSEIKSSEEKDQENKTKPSDSKRKNG